MASRVSTSLRLANRTLGKSVSTRAGACSSPLCGPRVFHQQRFYSSQEPRSSGSDRIKFWPFIALIGLGTAGYIQLANTRVKIPAPAAQLAQTAPVFSPSDVTVVFVLGGPGAGKGTQCARLVAEQGFTHLSAGDLLREEQDRPGSQFGQLIKDYIKDGLIVPMEVTIKLLENAMTAALREKGSTKGRFLIDGFPRKMDQAHKFEEAVCPAKLVLFFDCPEKVMEERLLERGKTSGRTDDNAESIRKRFRTFIETSMPVVNFYEGQGKVIKVDATPTPENVFNTTNKLLTEKLASS
ncbi:uridylate kinase [Trichoderma arundinaceum]|uniref:Uridylate kinase n=1 Tax=Trichoderma arundinaceum TaxID=490622 RepID=A0A395N9Z9_TRIAR|nr:uridylate kinase [Trichoderma arundinaceum]